MSTKTPNKQASEKEQTQKRVERESQQPDQTLQPSPTEALQRAANAPRSVLRPAHILALQSSVGNRAAQRLVDGAPTGGVAPVVVQRHISDASFEGMQHYADRTAEEIAVLSDALSEANADVTDVATANRLVSSDVKGASEGLEAMRAARMKLMFSLSRARHEKCETETEEG